MRSDEHKALRLRVVGTAGDVALEVRAYGQDQPGEAPHGEAGPQARMVHALRERAEDVRDAVILGVLSHVDREDDFPLWAQIALLAVDADEAPSTVGLAETFGCDATYVSGSLRKALDLATEWADD